MTDPSIVYGLPENEDERAEAEPGLPAGKELVETAVVMRALAVVPSQLGIDQIARTFGQGKQVESRVALTILALARLGHISTPDNGRTFALRGLG